MQDRYVGDANDFLKWSLLLRIHAHTKRQLGVLWYLTRPGEVDRTNPQQDGGNTGYLLKKGDWRNEFHAELYQGLRQLIVEDERVVKEKRSVTLFEGERILPADTRYFNMLVPEREFERKAWLQSAREALRESSLLFLDPDNGPWHLTNSRKHVGYAEWSHLASEGCPVLCISHPRQTNRCVHHAKLTAAANVRCSAYASNCGFHLLVDYQAADAVAAAMRDFAKALDRHARVHFFDNANPEWNINPD